MIKRGVDLQSLDPQDKKPIRETNQANHPSKRWLRQRYRQKISKTLKESDLKVSVSIQGDKIRISDKKKDNLQLAMAFLKEKTFGVPLQFNNFKD